MAIRTGLGLATSDDTGRESEGQEARRALGVGSVFAGVGIVAGPLGLALGTVVGSTVTGVTQLIKRRARAKAVRDQVLEQVSKAQEAQVTSMRAWVLEIQGQVSMRVQSSAAAYERMIRGGGGVTRASTGGAGSG